MQREFILRDGEIAFNRPDGTVVIMNTNTYLNLMKREDEPKEDHVDVYLKQIAALQAALIKEKAQHKDFVEVSDRALAALRDQAKRTIDNLHSQINEVKRERDEYAQKVQDYKAAYNAAADKHNKLVTDKNLLAEQLSIAKKSINDLEEKVINLKNRVIPEVPRGYMTADGVIITGTIQPRMGLYLTSDGKLYAGQKAVEGFENIPTGAVSNFLCGRQNTLRNRKGEALGVVEVAWSCLFAQPRTSDRDAYWAKKLAEARELRAEQQ